MKTLFPKQRDSVESLKSVLHAYRGALDSSLTGTGKTVVACHTALEIGLPVCVVCPKIVIPHWERELAEVGIVPVFVTNYEKLRRGTKHIVKVGKKLFRWQLPVDTLIIWDECHKAKSAFSQNSQMLVAAKQAGYMNLMLSATACQDPTEMRSIGFVLNLHSLNRSEGKLRSWFSWMLSLGCRKDNWNNWIAGPLSSLSDLNKQMYSTNCVKLLPTDLPNAFSENHVITEPLAFTSLKDIAKYYDDHGITLEVIENALDGNKGAEPHVLVEILRARQLAEAAKVPDIVEMVKDALAEGFSVPIFVNFVDTAKALANHFPDASLVIGGQKAVDREIGIQKFQTNKTRVIICNIAAGGVGVSLHDTDGNFPRMSMISPTFNVKDYIQTLGRIHRAGALSPSIQRVLVASKTIEEKIISVLEKKRLTLDTLHAKSLS